MTYYSPKRNKLREIAFYEDLLPILSKLLEQKKSGIIIQYRNIHNMGRAVERYFEKLKMRRHNSTDENNTEGISTKNYSMKTFRKTFITLCRSRYNMDATIVRELVGYDHSNTTMRSELEKFKRPQ